MDWTVVRRIRGSVQSIPSASPHLFRSSSFSSKCERDHSERNKAEMIFVNWEKDAIKAWIGCWTLKVHLGNWSISPVDPAFTGHTVLCRWKLPNKTKKQNWLWVRNVVVPSFLTFCLRFFIPFFTSSSLSVAPFVSLLPLRLLDSLPTGRWTVRSHPLPRKQGLKFKAAVVDLAEGVEHRGRQGLPLNPFIYCPK